MIISLHSYGVKQVSIAKELQVTRSQVRYTLSKKDTPTPSKRSGRPLVMTEEQTDELEVFVTSTRTGLLMSYFELARVQFRHRNVSEHVVRRVLRSRGYERRIAQSKPPLRTDHMRRRKMWAEEHLKWTIEEWCRVLWTDETWVNGQRHSNTWVTRKVGNEMTNSTRLTFDHSNTKLT